MKFAGRAVASIYVDRKNRQVESKALRWIERYVDKYTDRYGVVDK